MMVEPVRSALEYYRRLNEAHHKNSLADASGNGSSGPPSPTKHVLKSQSSYSVRKTSITFSQVEAPLHLFAGLNIFERC